MIILLFGPPGCGKGTQDGAIAKRLQIPAISTGELFRAECKAGTAIGRTACSILSKGGFISDEIVNQMVADRIERPDCRGGFLLDGYPRTLPQAIHFSSVLKQRELPEPVVIHLSVPEPILLKRLLARRQCSSCQRIYNLLSNPPRVEGQCDVDGAALTTRDDDREPVIRQRLSTYHGLTEPILEWFGERLVHRIDGGKSPQEVARAIEEVLEATPMSARYSLS